MGLCHVIDSDGKVPVVCALSGTSICDLFHTLHIWVQVSLWGCLLCFWTCSSHSGDWAHLKLWHILSQGHMVMYAHLLNPCDDLDDRVLPQLPQAV